MGVAGRMGCATSIQCTVATKSYVDKLSELAAEAQKKRTLGMLPPDFARVYLETVKASGAVEEWLEAVFPEDKPIETAEELTEFIAILFDSWKDKTQALFTEQMTWDVKAAVLNVMLHLPDSTIGPEDAAQMTIEDAAKHLQEKAAATASEAVQEQTDSAAALKLSGLAIEKIFAKVDDEIRGAASEMGAAIVDGAALGSESIQQAWLTALDPKTLANSTLRRSATLHCTRMRSILQC